MKRLFKHCKNRCEPKLYFYLKKRKEKKRTANNSRMQSGNITLKVYKVIAIGRLPRFHHGTNVSLNNLNIACCAFSILRVFLCMDNLNLKRWKSLCNIFLSISLLQRHNLPSNSCFISQELVTETAGVFQSSWLYGWQGGPVTFTLVRTKMASRLL